MLFKDTTINAGLEKIQKRIKKRYGKDIATNVIYKIVSAQFEAVNRAVCNMEEISLPRFGKFLHLTSEKAKNLINNKPKVKVEPEDYTPTNKLLKRLIDNNLIIK